MKKSCFGFLGIREVLPIFGLVWTLWFTFWMFIYVYKLAVISEKCFF